jgi:hypothetical protein
LSAEPVSISPQKLECDWNRTRLIDYLRFYVPLKNFSLIWRRYHCRWSRTREIIVSRTSKYVEHKHQCITKTELEKL